MKKILYFTTDFSPENIAFAKANGLTPRNLNAYHNTDFVEQCDFVCGDVPERYAHLPQFELAKDELPKDDNKGDKKESKKKGEHNDPKSNAQ